jgi:integrase
VAKRTDMAFYTPEEVRALARCAEDEQDAAILLTAALTGLRMGELLALRWRSVDFSASTVRVTASYSVGQLGTPKSGCGRAVPLVDEAAETLARLAARDFGTEPDDLVFVGRAGSYLDGSALKGSLGDAPSASARRVARRADQRRAR